MDCLAPELRFDGPEDDFGSISLDQIAQNGGSGDFTGSAPQDALGESWAWHQDPMDLDYDTEIAAWISSWGRPADDAQPSVARQSPNNNLWSLPEEAGPSDLLFPDDEAAMSRSKEARMGAAATAREPPSSNTPASKSNYDAPMTNASRITRGSEPTTALGSYELDLNDPETLRLYDDILLLSRKGACGDQLEFDDCSESREAILHLLAMRFALDYKYDRATRKAFIRRPANVTAKEISRSQHHIKIICPSGPPDVSPDDLAPQSEDHQLVPFHRDEDKVSRTVGKSDGCNGSLGVVSPLSPPSQLTDSPFGVPIDADQHLIRQSILDKQANSSLSHRLSSSWTIFHSGISSRRPRGRRGPLSDKTRKEIKVLEAVGGACWRCRIIRRKCDAGAPCKSCPVSHLREDEPPWPLIGCRRGSLQDAMPPQLLCPVQSRRGVEAALPFSAISERPSTANSSTSRIQPEIISQCFREAEVQRLSDNKMVLENASLFLRSRGNSPAANHFSHIMRTGRYRANACLSGTYQVDEKQWTYADLITSIAWELTDNPDCVSLLDVESVESFMLLLETASMYEAEVGKSSMVILSLICLLDCLDCLRLHSAHLLVPELHEACSPERCSVSCLQDLRARIYTYVDELSVMMFKKVNLRDRRWWLSTFYSLCIQSYVRRALLAIEQQLTSSYKDEAELNSAQYLQLITVLFICVSFQYDPLSSGRLQSLASESTDPGTAVPELFLASARTVCGAEMWPREGIKSSYQFLTRMLNIGSLDFDNEAMDVQMMELPTPPVESPCTPPDIKAAPKHKSISFSIEQSEVDLPSKRQTAPTIRSFESIYSTPNSSGISLGSSLLTTSTGITNPHCGPISERSSFSAHRNSMCSITSRLSSMPDAFGSTTRLPLVPPLQRRPQNTTQSSNTSALFVCLCCPKKPQSFGTPEELKAHERKKPHICAFCNRRFSRHNEADRHIDTIHYRPYSWSCATLESPLAAFQSITVGEETFDVCGFCGREFKRNGDDDSRTDQETEELIAHAHNHHKLGECNAAKKFFREDLFGQHLKSSHAAEPGVWMKALQNLCKTKENYFGRNEGANRQVIPSSS